MRRPSLGTAWLLCALVFLTLPRLSHAQAEAPPTVEMQLRAAAAQGDPAVLEGLLVRHRLTAKPVVLALLAESMAATQRGAMDEARQHRAAAEVLARQVAAQFGEQSLMTAVGYLATWTPEQITLKCHADSLEALGTALRGTAATREDALAHYRAALEAYRALGDALGVATTLGGIGYVHWWLDRSQYLGYNLEALEARRAVDDRELIGNSLGDVALAYRVIERDNETAIGYYLEAEQVRTALGDTVGLGRTVYAAAVTYKALDRLPEALAYYTRAAALNTASGNENLAANALIIAGSLQMDFGRYAEALDLLREALALRTARGDDQQIAEVLNEMGKVYRRLGDFEAALEHYQRVIVLAEMADDAVQKANAYLNIGSALLFAERPARATTYFERARTQFEALGDANGTLAAISNLGSSHFETGDYEAAEGYLREALAMSRAQENSVVECRTLSLLGNTLNYTGRLDEALESYQTALAMGQQLESSELQVVALMGLVDNYERRGEADRALALYDQVFAQLEATLRTQSSADEKAGLLGQQRYAYEAALHLLTTLHEEQPDAGYEVRAFEYAERAKARAFLDQLAEALAQVGAGVDPVLRAEEERLLAALATAHTATTQAPDRAAKTAANATLDSLQAVYDAVRRDLRRQNPKYAELQYPEPSSLAEIQTSLLTDDTVLLEYALGDSSSALWVITKDTRTLHRLPRRADLQAQVELLRFALLNPAQTTPARFAEASRRLYAHLLGPAEAALGAGKALVIIPDGVLYYVPFEALLTADADSGATYGTLPYLVRRHAVSYGSSASVLQRLRTDRPDRPAPAKQLLAFGDPHFADPEAASGPAAPGALERLPYSGVEVENIAQYFPPGQADVFLGEAATEARFKALDAQGGYRYLHFATHGLINESRPDFSSIALAYEKNQTEDGFLQAAEIFNLQIDADLVVLSACETGLGKMVRGEGMVGLTRAFMYAGASSLVVSLWRVADASTSNLMAHFYENLIVARHSKTEALRRAKVALLEDDAFAHPFHWAPFVLMGDWQ